jgi:diaminopimelate decarboxylase
MRKQRRTDVDHFHYKGGILHAENVPLPRIAEAVGTPFYCYSTATLTRHFTVFRDSLAALNPSIFFAVKANSNPHVLRVLGGLGAGADVVSEGEIRLALAGGIPASRMVFSGVGKTRGEMAYALTQGIFQFNVESEAELRVLSDVAASLNLTAPIALRINPDVDAGTHEKITTGRKDSKFGIDIDDAKRVYGVARTLPNIRIQGVSVHIGSQLTDLTPFRAAYIRVRTFVEELRAEGVDLRVVDLGGGLGIPYVSEAEVPPIPKAYGAMIAEVMQGMDAEFLFEPGRLIVGNAGVLVSSVIYLKENANQFFLVIDAAMNDLMRPALYGAHHEIVPVHQVADWVGDSCYHVVGAVCESSDVFRRNVLLPPLTEGDLVAFRSAGAYGASMSNSYNARPLIPEVLVDGDDFRIIRPRQSYEDMLSGYAT